MPPGLEALYVLPVRSLVVCVILAAVIGAGAALLSLRAYLRFTAPWQSQPRCGRCRRYVRKGALCRCLTERERC